MIVEGDQRLKELTRREIAAQKDNSGHLQRFRLNIQMNTDQHMPMKKQSEAKKNHFKVLGPGTHSAENNA